MIEVVVPREIVNDDRVTLVKWLVEPGAQVSAGSQIAEYETSKTLYVAEATHAGFIAYRTQAGTEVEVGSLIAWICATPEEARQQSQSQATPKTPVQGPSSSAVSSRLSRDAQKLIETHGIDPAVFSHIALVRSRDVEAWLASDKKSSAAPTANVPTSVERPAQPAWQPAVPSHKVELARTKIAEGKILANWSRQVVTSSVTVATRCADLAALSAHHPVLRGNVLALVLSECGRLLERYPHFNGWFGPEGMAVYDEINIGIAIDDGRGLKVPVLRGVNRRALAELVLEVESWLVRYDANQIAPADMTGGTFTITDLSRSGVQSLQPVINQGQSAILALGESRFGAERGLVLTMAFDHQVAEGLLAANFLGELRTRLEAVADGLRPRDLGMQCSSCGMTLRECRAAQRHLLTLAHEGEAMRFICNVCLAGW